MSMLDESSRATYLPTNFVLAGGHRRYFRVYREHALERSLGRWFDHFCFDLREYSVTNTAMSGPSHRALIRRVSIWLTAFFQAHIRRSPALDQKSMLERAFREASGHPNAGIA